MALPNIVKVDLVHSVFSFSLANTTALWGKFSHPLGMGSKWELFGMIKQFGIF